VYRVSLKGKTTIRSYTIQWDYIEPYYTCLQQYGTSCDVPPLDLKDVTVKTHEQSIPWQCKVYHKLIGSCHSLGCVVYMIRFL
jgi:hypothetical protein